MFNDDNKEEEGGVDVENSIQTQAQDRLRRTDSNSGLRRITSNNLESGSIQRPRRSPTPVRTRVSSRSAGAWRNYYSRHNQIRFKNQPQDEISARIKYIQRASGVARPEDRHAPSYAPVQTRVRRRRLDNKDLIDLTGKTVVICASGPSLCQEDTDLVEQSGLITVAVNRSYEMVNFAHIMYAGDDRWWQEYHSEVPAHMEKWTCAKAAAHRFKLNLHRIKGAYNSGLRAIQLVVERGASKIILLGFDCQHTAGKAHWHSDYQNLGNAVSYRRWPFQFEMYARQLGTTAEVINASRESALTCWPRILLVDALDVETLESD